MSILPTTSLLSLREAGFDEFQLRDRIFEDPTILGLGNLEPVTKEKSQPQGGRLDLLLKNPEDDSMYEVEIQLGSTDESHIIRTIEYWESEKRRWPRRSHTAVLVAENITNRFFNVVNLLSQALPIIAIQANVVVIGGFKALHFTKILDTYEEPEESDTPQATYDENHWLKKSPAGLECARWYKEQLDRLYADVPIKYFESYISLNGRRYRPRLDQIADRGIGHSLMFKPAAASFSEAVDFLNGQSLPFGTRSGKYLTLNVSIAELREAEAVHVWLLQRLAPELSKDLAAS